MTKILSLLLLILPLQLWAQNQELELVKGNVFNKKNGQPLPGVSIYVENSTVGVKYNKDVVSNYSLGTVSDIDGNFSIKLPKNINKLTFSMIGFENRTITLTGKQNYSIELNESNSMINQVMVTGYQKIKQARVTGAMAQIKGEDIIQNSQPTVDNLLIGQSAGVQIEATSGAPGAPAKIRIRGTATLEGTQDPLWVLDGMPLENTDLPDLSGKDIDQLVNTSIAGLNPSDIESITILKDAAATAIYGARAANGVIVITTKKGNKGALSINLSTNWYVNQRPDFDRLNLLNSDQKVDLELDLASRSDITYNNDKGQVARILSNTGEYSLYQNSGFDALSTTTQAAINHLKKTNTNWGKELYHNAISQNHSISIAGGDEKATYYFSTAYYKEEGTTIGTSMDRLNVTMKANFQLASWMDMGISIFGNNRKQKSYLTGTDSFTNPSRYSRTANPYLAIYDENGDYVYDPEIEGYSDRYIDYNIIEERNGTSNEQSIFNTTNIIDFDIRFSKHVHLKSQFGISTDKSAAEQFADKNTYYARKQHEKSRYYSNGDYKYFIPEGGTIKNTDVNSYNWNFKNMLYFSKVFAENHALDLMIGSELRKDYTKTETATAYGFDSKTLTVTPIVFPDESYGDEFSLYSRNRVTNAYTSFFGTLNYTYNHKYTIFGSIRSDGSNVFGVDPKYKYLPLYSFGGAWNINRENWLKNNSWINYLKLRISYGLQGNIDKSTSPFIVGDYDNSTILPDETESTIVVTSPPNETLRWEKTKTWNVGIDLSSFRNRINLGVDLYHRRSEDLIAPQALPQETGFSTVSVNWGEVTNKGIEISLTTKNVQGHNFSWSSSFNISKNINKVNKIHINENQVSPSTEGYSVNTLFALPTNGIDDQGYPIFVRNGKDETVSEFFDLTALWGIPELVTSNLSNEELRSRYKEVGSTDPKWSGGFTNTFNYKNWTLIIATNFNIGQWRKETPFYSMTEFERGINTTTSIDKIWSEENPSGIYPGLVGANSYNGDRALDYYWMTGNGQSINTFKDLDIWYKKLSYLRVNSIRLEYNLPQNLYSTIGLKNVKVSFEAKNPFVISTDYSGYFDPETFGNIYAQPIAKSIMLGLNLTF